VKTDGSGEGSSSRFGGREGDDGSGTPDSGRAERHRLWMFIESYLRLGPTGGVQNRRFAVSNKVAGGRYLHDELGPLTTRRQGSGLLLSDFAFEVESFIAHCADARAKFGAETLRWRGRRGRKLHRGHVRGAFGTRPVKASQVRRRRARQRKGGKPGHGTHCRIWRSCFRLGLFSGKEVPRL